MPTLDVESGVNPLQFPERKPGFPGCLSAVFDLPDNFFPNPALAWYGVLQVDLRAFLDLLKAHLDLAGCWVNPPAPAEGHIVLILEIGKITAGVISRVPG